ncbi:MAG: FHA domain-containing protein, partial [Lentisphaeria bacterium]|nr:FHA domain-containing protein [Lentisphaeria bacterium]
MERWTLTVIDGSEQGLEKPLNEEVILGRSLDNDLMLSHSAVSRRHARIFAVGFVIYVEDLESTHGTKVNGETCSKRALNNNDIISVGPVSMKIACEQAAPNPEATNVIYVQPTGAPSIHDISVHDTEKAVADHDISARLEAVLQIGLTLQGEREIGPLLQRIGETLINTLAVERCGI